MHLYVYMCAFDPPSPGLSHDESTKRKGLHLQNRQQPDSPGTLAQLCEKTRRVWKIETARRGERDRWTEQGKQRKIAGEENISNKTAETKKVCDKDRKKEADEDCVGCWVGQKEKKKGEKVTYLEMKGTELGIVKETQRCWKSES